MHDVTPRSPTQVVSADAGDLGGSPGATNFEDADLRDFSRTIAQIDWLLVVGLIAACYLFLGYSTDHAFFSSLTAGGFAAELAPMLLVAYITTMLSADILNAMAKIKLISKTDDLTGIYNVRALYVSKAQGQDRVVVFSPG
jgi:hypothetical protein